MNFTWLASAYLTAFLFLNVFGMATHAEEPCKFHIHKIDTRFSQLSEKSGYVESVSVSGVQDKKSQTIIRVPFTGFTELETVTHLDAQYVENGKRKNIKDFATHSIIGNAFYEGIKCKTFVLEEKETECEVSYNYDIRNTQLMFLSYLDFSSIKCVDTFSYTIEIPNGLKLNYKIDGDTLMFKDFRITSEKGAHETIWQFMAVTKDIEPGKDLSLVRISIVPDLYSANEFAYMNKLYNQLLITQSELNTESIATISSWTKNRQGTELVKTLFDSIKSKISYIAFENGLGAVQPRNVNDVLRNRQGDCKDMANLLRQSIRYFGIPAWVAISSTLSYPVDLDFPSMCSANHAICVAEVQGKTYYLDATESFCQFGNPSRQIQGKYIFKIDSLEGKLIRIPIVPPAENKVTGKFYFTKKDNQLVGKFTYTLRGLSKIDIESIKGSRGKQTFDEVLTRYLSSQFRNIKIDSLNTIIADSALTITGCATATNAIMQVDKVNYLSQSILMYPHSFPKKLADEEKLVFYETMQRDFEFHITLGENFKFRPIPNEEFSENGFAFRYNATANPDEMVINYSLTSEVVELNDLNRKSYLKMNDQIVKVFNKKIAYE